MHSVLVIANPKAKLFRKSPSMIDALAARSGSEATFAAPETLHDLHLALLHAKESGVETIAVAGGDGTTARLCTSLMEAYGDAAEWPKIVLLRGGTMNTVAKGMGFVSGGPLERLDRLLSHDGELATFAQPLIRKRLLEGSGGDLGFLFGTGVFASFLMAYYDAGRGDPGPTTAATVLAKLVGSSLVRGPFAKRFAARTPMHVVLDGTELVSKNYLAVAVGTVPEVGLGFTPFPRTRDCADAFEVVAVHAAAHRVAPALHRVYGGDRLPEDVAHSGLGKKLVLKSDVPFFFMLDGDLYPPTNELFLDVTRAVRIAPIPGIDARSTRTV